MSPDPEPFCVFLADIAPDSPIKTLRLKLMLFLQGSPFFDLPDAARRLEAMPMLKFELAVILGRVSNHIQTNDKFTHTSSLVATDQRYISLLAKLETPYLLRLTVLKEGKLFLLESLGGWLVE